MFEQNPTIEGGIINTHAHPRNPHKDGDGRSELMIPLYNEVFSDVIAIGNTMTPLTNIDRAFEMKHTWQSLSPKTVVHVAGLLTEGSDPDEIVAGYDRHDGDEAWIAMKMFLRAVSNSGGHDVDNVKAIIPCVKAMTYTKWKHKKRPMVLKIHCERKLTPLGRVIPIDDRERIAVQRDVEYILQEVPEAVIEICHVSDGETIEAIRYFRSKGYNVTGEISPHYTEYSGDDLFDDGHGGTAFNSRRFCLPKFKSPKDRRIILDAMLSGEDCWHYGDDGACHDHNPLLPKGVKINSAGIVLGGQTQLPKAVNSYVVEQFVKVGRTEHLQGFLVNNARELYGLPTRNNVLTFRKAPWTVPEVLTHRFEDKTLHCHVAMGGQERTYEAIFKQAA